ncbi:MAG: hypothetical protein M3O29_05750, partial [Actinomycetota bacterium]|nr:hypothetical protein [Actinomycetota bacterium]
MTRLFVAALLVVPAVVASVSPSLAAPTAQDVQNAAQRVEQIKQDLATLNEQYNEALYKLQQAQAHVEEAQAAKIAAEKRSEEARARLSERAVDAYTGMGSQFDALLSSDSMTEFSDRLEFLGAMSQTDADLASQADTAAQQASWAQQAYDQAVADRQALADQLVAQRQQAEQQLADAQQYLSETSAAHDDWVQQQQEALRILQQQQQAAEQAPISVPPSDPPPDFNP